jgi:hypothetical protein
VTGLLTKPVTMNRYEEKVCGKCWNSMDFWSIWCMSFGPLPAVPPVKMSASRNSSRYPIHGHTDDIKHPM